MIFLIKFVRYGLILVRKTYYKYKERCISVCEIENMDDMVKLKNANTSTR